MAYPHTSIDPDRLQLLAGGYHDRNQENDRPDITRQSNQTDQTQTSSAKHPSRSHSHGPPLQTMPRTRSQRTDGQHRTSDHHRQHYTAANYLRAFMQ